MKKKQKFSHFVFKVMFKCALARLNVWEVETGLGERKRKDQQISIYFAFSLNKIYFYFYI